MPGDSRTWYQSVERALDVLEFLGRSEGELGVSEIGAATGLSVGTAHRLLGTLVSRGDTPTTTARLGSTGLV